MLSESFRADVVNHFLTSPLYELSDLYSAGVACPDPCPSLNPDAFPHPGAYPDLIPHTAPDPGPQPSFVDNRSPVGAGRRVSIPSLESPRCDSGQAWLV